MKQSKSNVSRHENEKLPRNPDEVTGLLGSALDRRDPRCLTFRSAADSTEFCVKQATTRTAASIAKQRSVTVPIARTENVFVKNIYPILTATNLRLVRSTCLQTSRKLPLHNFAWRKD